MSRVVSVNTAKGGSSKSSLSYALAARLATTPPRARVLLIDSDPQANATVRAGRDPDSDDDPRDLPGLGEVLRSELPLTEAIVGTVTDRLDLLPSGDLTNIDAVLAGKPGGEMAVRRSLAPLLEMRVYDWVVIDTPPQHGFTVRSTLVASDAIIAPTVASSGDSSTGVSDLMAMVDALGEAGMPVGVFAGVVATQQRGTKTAAAALESLQQWAPVIGVIKERQVWRDAENLQVPVWALASENTKQGEEMRAEIDEVITVLRKKTRSRSPSKRNAKTKVGRK